jgi:cytidylate kinase
MSSGSIARQGVLPMCIVTISRGTFSGGKALAECLASKLGYRCIDRDTVLERAAARGVSYGDLRAALDRPPSKTGALDHRKYIYMAQIQHALIEEVREGGVIYHGLVGHLLLKGGVGILRVRAIAPMSFRIREAQELLRAGPAEAAEHIRKMDEERRNWTRFLYGVDWEDPSLYDMVVNLRHISVEQACRFVAAALWEVDAAFSDEFHAAMGDLAIASRVRADLAVDPFTSNLEVEVESRQGEVLIGGADPDQFDEIERVVRHIPGVQGLSLKGEAAAAT